MSEAACLTRPRSAPAASDRRATLGARRTRELRTFAAMSRLYCGANHADGPELCPDCARLLTYAEARLRACPYGEEKPSCKQCPVHCYAAAPREQARRMMRFAGPRMILRHPVLALLHLADELITRRPPGPVHRKENS